MREPDLTPEGETGDGNGNVPGGGTDMLPPGLGIEYPVAIPIPCVPGCCCCCWCCCCCGTTEADVCIPGGGTQRSGSLRWMQLLHGNLRLSERVSERFCRGGDGQKQVQSSWVGGWWSG